jgi:hypothetical protein
MWYFNKYYHENKNIYIRALKLLHATVPSLLLRQVYKYLLLFLRLFSCHYWSLLPAFYLVLLLLLLTKTFQHNLLTFISI